MSREEERSKERKEKKGKRDWSRYLLKYREKNNIILNIGFPDFVSFLNKIYATLIQKKKKKDE